MSTPARKLQPVADDGLVWEEPPHNWRGGGSAGKWASILAPLMERPGQWARIATKDNPSTAGSVAKRLNAGELKRPEGRWEFTSRRRGEAGYGIYARYLGPEEQS